MILADTSVWIGHLRAGEPALAEGLNEGEILMHPFVAGELACGNLKDRSLLIEWLGFLPRALSASDAEVRALIERRRLWGRGLGWVDAHLLASALISGCRFWTLDRRLGETARDLGL